MLHPDIMGVRPLFDDLCRRLATHGFAVCAPEPFARAPVDVRGRRRSDGAAWAYVTQLDDDLQLGDLEAAADYLVVHDDVREVAVLGFCMGGMQVLKAAATGRFDRAVAFYGMIRAARRTGSARSTRLPLDTAADVCPTLAIFGGRDPFTPAADIEALRAAWADRPDCEIVVYPDAEHGFVHAPERAGAPGRRRRRRLAARARVPAASTDRLTPAVGSERGPLGAGHWRSRMR